MAITNAYGRLDRLFSTVGAPAVESLAAAVGAGSVPDPTAALFDILVNFFVQRFGEVIVSKSVKGVFRCLHVSCLLVCLFPNRLLVFDQSFVRLRSSAVHRRRRQAAAAAEGRNRRRTGSRR